jgi:uncharacterized membrane protein YhaH (DUF805 family)
MRYFLRAMVHYVDFSGGACRKEFWYFFPFSLIIYLVLQLIAVVTLHDLGSTDDDHKLIGIAMFALPIGMCLITFTLPYLLVSVRRLHDADFSGLWMLLHLTTLSLVVLIMHMIDGTPGSNRYGPDPLGRPGLFQPVAQPAPPPSSAATSWPSL